MNTRHMKVLNWLERLPVDLTASEIYLNTATIQQHQYRIIQRSPLSIPSTPSTSGVLRTKHEDRTVPSTARAAMELYKQLQPQVEVKRTKKRAREQAERQRTTDSKANTKRRRELMQNPGGQGPPMVVIDLTLDDG